MDLKDIKSPADLKGLSVEELDQIGAQLRETIIKQVSINGGHLAPNLGVIELTLALHFCYQTPKDKIVWDVGHQAYPHKLLTGRLDRFHTIRQEGGISGFPKLTESEHDAFGVGHASTSISAAIGYAMARDQLEQDHDVVAVIGDGSLTGGTAFEALNNAHLVKGNLTIVLNDNKMSIAPNVGAFSKYLNKLISDPTYNRLRDDVFKFTEKLPRGERIKHWLGTLQDAAKHTLLPGRLFEDLGIRYFGPIDGHDTESLIEIFKRVKTFKGPTLVHVITEKGRGWKHAEENSYKWHGTVPFDPESGEQLKAPSALPAFTKVFGNAVLELAKEDERIMGVTAAMPSGCGLDIVEKELPGRTIDVGIAEGHGVSFAAGMACAGMRPIVAIYSTFMQRAYDQVIHDVALQKLPVIFALDRAGLVGADGPTHHGAFDISYMRLIPNMTIMAPSDQDELRNMLYTAMKIEDGPVTIRYPRGSAVAQPKPGFEELEIGKMKVIEEGREILIIGVGHMLTEARKAADTLRDKGFVPTLVDARFVKPLDIDLLESMMPSHSVIVTMEDNSLAGGFGSGIAEWLKAKKQSEFTRLLRFGLPDKFVEHGEVPSLYKKLGIDGPSVAQSVMEALLPNDSLTRSNLEISAGD